MLALHHLFSDSPATDLSGVDAVLAEAGLKSVPAARRVVLVGNNISPGNPVTKPDGTILRTLRGELAYQLGGPAAFARVALDDENATNPGDVLRELLVEYGPCLVFIDEWVAYARQLHDQRGPARRQLRDDVHVRAGAEGGGARRERLLARRRANVSQPHGRCPAGSTARSSWTRRVSITTRTGSLRR